jgi:hypothetical protein
MGLILLGATMVWWGYGGFSAAIVTSIAMLTSVLGLSAEVTLNLAAYTAAGMLGLGVAVHLLVILVRAAATPRPRRSMPPPQIEPSFLRPPVVQTASAAQPPASAALLKPIGKPAPRGPGAIGVLFPQQAAE